MVLYVWLQRLNSEMQLGRRVRVLTVECPNDSVADHAAVFVLGLRQHENELGNAAPGGDIAAAEVAADHILQIFHAAIQTAPG